MSIDLTHTSAVVLVEGPSDAAVLQVLSRRLGLDGPDVSIVSMGGVTNIRHHLHHHGPAGLGLAVSGLCDGSEERFFTRALRREGHAVESRDDMEALGFFVCDADLEDELLHALGTARSRRSSSARASWCCCGGSSSSPRSASARCTTSCTASPG